MFRAEYTRGYTYLDRGSIATKRVNACSGAGATTSTYAYSNNLAKPPHAPSSVNGVNFLYDANGNMTKGLNGKVITYDAENRPVSVTIGSATTTYAYSGDGTRLKHTAPGGAVTLTFGPVEIRDFGGSETFVTYPHPSLRLVDGAAYGVHRDQLGSVRLMTGPDGLQRGRATYRPFGERYEDGTFAYREYVVPTPGVSHAGQRRVVIGNGNRYEIYYTADHYNTFVRVPW